MWRVSKPRSPRPVPALPACRTRRSFAGSNPGTPRTSVGSRDRGNRSSAALQATVLKHAALGDTVSAALDRSLLAWPTPLFQVNFMTGYVPSWQRNLYYRLSWAKASGARLDILWRLRQDYDAVNGWTGGRLTDLIRIEIRPASGSPVVWVEAGRC